MIREHIEILPGASEPKARIACHRIRGQDVVIWHEMLGMSPNEFEHAIAGENATIEALLQNNPGPLREKLTRGV